MTRASQQAEQQALNGLDASGTPTNLIGFVGLFNADPGTTGASGEFSGGGYARQACTWNAASAAQPSLKTNSSSLTFTNSGSQAANYFGAFSAVTAGTYGIGGALTSAVTAATITVAPGALTLQAS